MSIEQLTVVSSSPARTHSFELLYPNAKIRQVKPRFTEELMPRPLSVEPSEWPMEMAQEKALQDIAAVLTLAATKQLTGEGLLAEINQAGEGRHLRIYSDTITVKKNGDGKATVLEKPRDLVSWFSDKERGALALSDKHVEICTGITAIDMKNPNSHPATVLVRILSKMRPYTMEDLNQIIEKHGAQAVLTTAGGISIWNGGTSLYDGTVPLQISLQTDPYTEPVVIREIHDWQKMDTDQLKQILYGALPEAMDSLVDKLDSLAAQKKILDQIPVTVTQKASTKSR